MIVYVVESGQYSDHTYDGIFSTRQKAEDFIEHEKAYDLCRDDYWISERELDKFSEKIDQGLKAYRVFMDMNGDNAQAESCPIDFLNGKKIEYIKRTAKIWGECWAKNQAVAIKIINERRIQWLQKNT